MRKRRTMQTAAGRYPMILVEPFTQLHAVGSLQREGHHSGLALRLFYAVHRYPVHVTKPFEQHFDKIGLMRGDLRCALL